MSVGPTAETMLQNLNHNYRVVLCRCVTVRHTRHVCSLRGWIDSTEVPALKSCPTTLILYLLASIGSQPPAQVQNIKTTTMKCHHHSTAGSHDRYNDRSPPDPPDVSHITVHQMSRAEQGGAIWTFQAGLSFSFFANGCCC